jgi:hypothetical protein
VVLALAVGAKLYPVVLAPWLGMLIKKHCGWLGAVPSCLLFLGSSGLILAPMFVRPQPAVAAAATIAGGEATGAPSTSALEDIDPASGLKTFLQRWEMNDFLFLIVIENLKPQDVVPPGQTAWFSWFPERWREYLVSAVARFCQAGRWEAAFLLARGLTAAVFLVLAAYFASRAAGAGQGRGELEYAFLTIAWFWLLSPTQNPWYWIWALPLAAFARNRVWWLLSGVVFLYYLRFWFSYQFAEQPLLGTGHTGTAFFDLVVTWIEFGPWFVLLAISFLRRSVCEVSVKPC